MSGPVERKVTEADETRVVEFRPDALARLYAGGSLDLQQYEAGMRLRKLFEAAQVSPLKAQAYDRAYLDSDVVLSHSVGIVPRAGEAMKKLVHVQIQLGVPDWPICTAISCEDYHLTELIRHMPDSLRRYNRRSVGYRVSEAFDKLSKLV